MVSLPPLYGLLLAGGSSSRMQRDKAMLDYHGLPQLDWAFQLLLRHCERVYVSVRAQHAHDPTRARFPQIVDAWTDLGPIAGIASAQAVHPEAAWLVMACDLPFVGDATLRHLVAHRDPGAAVTAYRSASDGLPEPLCSIYEPASRGLVLEHIAAGGDCPRRLLVKLGLPLLEQPDPASLESVNTPEEFAIATLRLGGADSVEPP